MSTSHLEDRSVRLLSFLGKLFSGGRPVRLVLEPRLQDPAVVQFKKRTIYLDPDNSTVGDYILCASLLKFGRLVRRSFRKT